MLRVYTMKQVAMGAHQSYCGFLRRRNVQVMKPITAWAEISYPSANTRYSIYQLSVLTAESNRKDETLVIRICPLY